MRGRRTASQKAIIRPAANPDRRFTTPGDCLRMRRDCQHQTDDQTRGSATMSIYLEDEQLALFEQLLEAWRAMPRDQRVPFLYVRTMGANIVQGNGLNLQVADGDIEALRAEGLLSFDGDSFTISARSVASYRE